VDAEKARAALDVLEQDIAGKGLSGRQWQVDIFTLWWIIHVEIGNWKLEIG
jgi:hypothetical protein